MHTYTHTHTSYIKNNVYAKSFCIHTNTYIHTHTSYIKNNVYAINLFVYTQIHTYIHTHTSYIQNNVYAKSVKTSLFAYLTGPLPAHPGQVKPRLTEVGGTSDDPPVRIGISLYVCACTCVYLFIHACMYVHTHMRIHT
jgi:hypothetical protein